MAPFKFKKLFKKPSDSQIHAKDNDSNASPRSDSKNDKVLEGDHNGKKNLNSSLPTLKEDGEFSPPSDEYLPKNPDDFLEYIGVSQNPGSCEFFVPKKMSTSGLGMEHSPSLNTRIEALDITEESQFSRPAPTMSSVPPSTRTGTGVAVDVTQPSPSSQVDSNDPNSLSQTELQSLVEDLRMGPLQKQKQAAMGIRQSCKSNNVCRKQVGAAGCIPLLLLLVQSEDPEMAEHAVTALLNLFISKENRTVENCKEAILPLVYAMQSESPLVCENAPAAVFLLSLEDENKIEIGALGAIPPLVAILRSGSATAKSDACKALFNLSILSANKWRIVDADAVDVLMDVLEDPESKLAERAVSILANLSTIPEGRNAIADHEDGISRLGEVLEDGTQIGKENASAALLQLAKFNPLHRQMIINEGLIPPLVSLSQKGTPRAREKAVSLLNNLRET